MLCGGVQRVAGVAVGGRSELSGYCVADLVEDILTVKVRSLELKAVPVASLAGKGGSPSTERGFEDWVCE